MSITIGAISFVVITLLTGLRVPIALSLGGVAFIGMWIIVGPTVTLAVAKSTPFEVAASWELSAVPLFILMGNIAFRTGMTESLFRAARLWLGWLPGGLAVATNFASAGFSAASGSSLATTIAMGRLAIPEMRKFGYDNALTLGTVTAAGTLGSLIPPSIILVIYGIFAEQSVSKLFIAAIVPGIITAIIYAAMIIIRCWLNPALAPVPDKAADWGERFSSLIDIWPLPLLVAGVIGSIYTGIATATEAAALGATLAFLIALAQRRLTVRNFSASLTETVVSSGALFFIAVGAILMNRFMGFSGLPTYLANMLEVYAVDPWMLLLLTGAFFFILGTVMEGLGMVLLTLPILIPVFQSQGFDLIWFGILVVKFVEIAALSPPLGLNMFAAASIAPDIPITTVFRGVMWFIFCEFVVVLLLILFPEMTHWLLPAGVQ